MPTVITRRMQLILSLAVVTVDAAMYRALLLDYRGHFAHFAVLVLSLGLAAGCASTSSQLRERFARERGCPEGQVAVREKGGTLYEASGCGKSAEYSCSSFTSKDSARACEERGLSRQAPAAEQRRFPGDVRYEAPK